MGGTQVRPQNTQFFFRGRRREGPSRQWVGDPLARLLFLASRDITNPQIAGGDITMYHVASRLARDGHEIRYICSRLPGMIREDKQDGMRVIRLGNLFTTSPKFLVRAWTTSRRWADAIVEEVVGGLRVPYLSAWYADLPRLCFWYQRNRLLFENQYGPVLGGVLARFERGITRLYTDAIILTPSETSKSDLVELGLPGERIHVYRPGIDDALLTMARPHPATKEPLMVTIGK